MQNLLLVGLGGAVGSMLRAGLAMAWPAPWATLGVNLVGSLAIGLLAARLLPGDAAWWLLATGLLGGFTTFSAFTLDAVRLVEAGRPAGALLYVGGSVGVGLLACALGLWLGRPA
jgi:fluoride exporter